MSTKFRIVFSLWFLALVNYLDRVAISFAGPSIMDSLSISPAQFGVVLSSFGVGYALALIPGGMISDRWGARAVLVVGPLFWALFTGMTGLVTTTLAFVIVRVCFGFSEGIFSPSIYKVVGDNFEPKSRAGILAIVLSALALGPALAGPMVGTLVSQFSWQVMFLCMTVPALLASMLAHFLIPKHGAASVADAIATDPETLDEQSVTFFEVLKRPSLWLVSLSNLCTDIAQWGFLGWMPTYLALERQIDLKHAGMIGSIPYIAAFFGLLAGGGVGSSTWLHRLRAQVVVVCYLAGGLSLFLAYNATTLFWAVAGLSATAFFMFGALAPKGAVVIALAPERHRAAYVGTYSVAGQIGGASAPAVIGFMVSASGSFATGFALMTASLCIAGVCMLALIPMMKRDRSTEARLENVAPGS